MNILFIGSNPSKKNIDPNVPFKGTKSEYILNAWIKVLEVQNYTIINIFDKVTESNRPLSRREIKSCLVQLKRKLETIKYDKIIALGKSASDALKILKVDHYKMYHPSPRNRMLNAKESLQNELERCKVYLYDKK